MKNDKIIQSFHEIEPDETTQKRMLHQILNRAKSGETRITKASSIRKGMRWLAPAAVCLIIAIVVLVAVPGLLNIENKPGGNLNPAVGSIDYSLRGLPAENFNLADIGTGGMAMDRIVFDDFGRFFEYGVDLFAFARVTHTKQWEDSSSLHVKSLRQISTIQIIDTLWEKEDRQSTSLSLNQSLYGGCLGDEKTNLLREGGLYLLPLKQSDGDWYIWGDLDVLFEVDDQGYVWSHSKFDAFKRYDGKNVGDFSSDLKKMISNEDFMLANSPFGNTLQWWTLADISLSSKSDKTTSKNGTACFDYTFVVNEVHSNPEYGENVPLEKTGHITVYADEADAISLVPGERYLVFLDRHEGEIFINPRMIARIGDDGIITAIPAADDRSMIGASVFTAYNGYKINDMRDMVSRINVWREKHRES